MKNILYFLIPAVFFVTNQNYQSSDPSVKIIAGLQQWHDNHPQEKIFLQTDKEKYLAGESVWLKMWCALENRPSYLSKIVYAEITDENGTVVGKKMFHTDSSSSVNGEIDLAKDLKSGYYALNAYSLWMLNYPDFIFRKNIFIYNSDYSAKKNIKKADNKTVSFFPEGGDMIEDVDSRVAFKAINETGYPLDVKGAVYNNAGNKITDFQSQHDGMGLFNLKPAPNTTYIAKVTFDNGSIAEYKLPVAKKEGVTLQVQNNSASRIFILINRGSLNKENYNKFFVVAQVNGNPVYKADFNLDEGESGASFVKKNLPPGILQVTLFDSLGNPLAERLTFIDTHQVNEPNVTAEKLNINKRAQNIFSFRLDSLSEPAIAVSVLKSSLDPLMNIKENIASSFLLSSDVKGYIHNPGYYFSNKASATLKDLDLLLMTQGWRRFTWKQVKGEESITLKYPVETFMNIKGKVTKSDRTDPVTSGLVTVMIKGDDSTSILSNAYLTDKGEFIIDSLNFKSKARISYQGTNNKKEQLSVDVKIYPSFIDSLKHSVFTPRIAENNQVKEDRNDLPVYLQSGLKDLDTTGIKLKVLGNISVKSKRISSIDSLQKEYVKPFFENSDQTLIIPEGKTFINIWQYLNQNVPGLNVNPFQPGGVTGVTFGRHEGLAVNDSDAGLVKFFLNEIPVQADIIDGIDPVDVALIKIYKGATSLVFGADAGAISVYTKKGVDAGGAIFDKKFKHADKIGFAVSREYYNPNYTSFPNLSKNETDNRQVLYWNPRIKPSKDGNYSIHFHNSDEAGSFKLIIQGMDKNGKLIYKEQLLQ